MTVGEGDWEMKGSMSSSFRDGVGASEDSATLSLLEGRANGLLDRSDPSCDGLLTNGDCLSGESSGDADLVGCWNVLIGDVVGDAARMVVDEDMLAGDSGRLNGDGRGEKDILYMPDPLMDLRANLIVR